MTLRYRLILVSADDLDALREASEDFSDAGAAYFIDGAILEETLSDDEATMATEWAEAHGAEIEWEVAL